MTDIHPTAIISSDARLASGVVVGPHVVIGSDVVIGAGTTIGPFTRIEGPVTIGERNRIVSHASIGTDAQDLKYKGERTELVIGNDNVIREFVSLNRGTGHGGGVTRIGSNNFFMIASHVAHDCQIGSHTIFANNASLAGHCEVGDHVTIAGFTAVHQFCRIGEHAFIGGFSVITQDVLPYIKTVGNRPPKTYGINTIGLQRKGFPPETIEALQRAYRVLVRSKLNLQDALAKIETDFGSFPEARYLVDFVRKSERGVIR